MHERKRRKSRKRTLRFQAALAAFCCGVVSAVPAPSYADELDDVLDDLISYRSEKRIASQGDALLPDEKPESTGKILRGDRSAKPKPQQSKDANAAKSSKITATKK